MIAKSITVLHNDNGISSDEQREEILKLRAKLKTAEEARLSGATDLYAGGIQKTDGGDLSV